VQSTTKIVHDTAGLTTHVTAGRWSRHSSVFCGLRLLKSADAAARASPALADVDASRRRPPAVAAFVSAVDAADGASSTFAAAASAVISSAVSTCVSVAPSVVAHCRRLRRSQRPRFCCIAYCRRLQPPLLAKMPHFYSPYVDCTGRRAQHRSTWWVFWPMLLQTPLLATKPPPHRLPLPPEHQDNCGGLSCGQRFRRIGCNQRLTSLPCQLRHCSCPLRSLRHFRRRLGCHNKSLLAVKS